MTSVDGRLKRGGAAGQKRTVRVRQKDAPRTPAAQGQGGSARAYGFPTVAPVKERGLASAVLARDLPASNNF